MIINAAVELPDGGRRPRCEIAYRVSVAAPETKGGALLRMNGSELPDAFTGQTPPGHRGPSLAALTLPDTFNPLRVWVVSSCDSECPQGRSGPRCAAVLPWLRHALRAPLTASHAYLADTATTLSRRRKTSRLTHTPSTKGAPK